MNKFLSTIRGAIKNRGSDPDKFFRQHDESRFVNPHHLFFGQQHAFTIDYFQNRFGFDWTRVPITQTPHYLFVAGDEVPYREYLSHSWRYFYGESIPPSKVEDRIVEFRRLISDIQQSGSVSNALKLYWSADCDLIIADGNHRASIAAYLGIKCPADIASPERQANEIIKVPIETFGSSVSQVPYQTIYHGRRVLVKGRRDDLLVRFDAINQAYPIKGKTILDLGSNYGMASYLALRLGGAKSSCLVETSSEITQAAIRLSVLLNSSNKTFIVGNLQADMTKVLPKFDIGFCFSITAHVGEIENLAILLKENVCEAVFYETHEGRGLEPQIASKFAKVRKLCDLGRRQLFMLSK